MRDFRIIDVDPDKQDDAKWRYLCQLLLVDDVAKVEVRRKPGYPNRVELVVWRRE